MRWYFGLLIIISAGCRSQTIARDSFSSYSIMFVDSSNEISIDDSSRVRISGDTAKVFKALFKYWMQLQRKIDSLTKIIDSLTFESKRNIYAKTKPMGENSKIEWTKHTANLWWGCTKVTAGCDHCYAETLSNRYSTTNVWGNKAPRRIIESVWEALDKYQNAAKKAGEMHRVFVGSMMDIFEKPMPTVYNNGKPGEFDTGYHRTLLFEAIDDGRYNNLLFLLLTKRPSNILKYIPDNWKTEPRFNVMYGTSPCDQKTAEKLIPQLCNVPGKRFLSIEPLLGPVDLNKQYPAYEPDYDCVAYWRLIGDINWIIVGGESGPGKRPMDLAWARSIRDQCLSTGVPFFMKQIDKVQAIPDDLMIRQFPTL